MHSYGLACTNQAVISSDKHSFDEWHHLSFDFAECFFSENILIDETQVEMENHSNLLYKNLFDVNSLNGEMLFQFQINWCVKWKPIYVFCCCCFFYHRWRYRRTISAVIVRICVSNLKGNDNFSEWNFRISFIVARHPNK